MTNARRLLLGAAACAALTAIAAVVVTLARPATASVQHGRGSTPRHVVVVGISGLRWSQVTRSAAPVLWRLAASGSVGDLVGYTQRPVACPADGWLTLNSGARAAAPPPAPGEPCEPLPAVTGDGTGARIPAMARLIAYNAQFHEDPDWGVLGRLASCATAVGPGAALALAAPDGAVPGYVPSPAEVSAGLLARCPLTLIDLGQNPYTERIFPSATDQALARIVAELPPNTLLLVTAPGGAGGSRLVVGRPRPGPAGVGREVGRGRLVGETESGKQDRGNRVGETPHLLTTVVSGPGYGKGLLTAASTRRPGIVTLTDLTPTVAHWLGRPVPGYLTGSVITRGDRGPLAATIRSLIARDTAEQVWMSTHAWFFAGYAALDALLLGIPAVIFWGASERNRRRRATCWSVTGVIAASVPAGTFLAGLAPWAAQSRPSVWLYGLSAGWTAVLAGLSFAVGRWRRGPLTSAWLICLITLCVLAVDVMSGSRLQLETPFGLSLLEAGRYYGIGNNALGVYCVSALIAVAFAVAVGAKGTARPSGVSVGGPGGLSSRRGGMGGAQPPMSRGGLGGIVPPGIIVPPGMITIFAVVASGWPGFGAKVGGTIAMVPCFALLFLALAGVRPSWRYAVPAALSGLVLVAVFALVSYLVPAAGVSDIGAFAGNLLHGHGGALLERKASSNLGTLTVSALSPLVPVGVVLAGLALWRPSWFRLRTLQLAFESSPLLRVTVWLVWLVLVLGWLADDSGVIVPAAATPFVIPLVIAMTSSVSNAGAATGYRSKTFAGSSVAGQPVKLRFGLGRHAVQYQLSRLTAGPVLYSLALGRPTVTGQEYVPETGPAILASNHLSVVDSFYLPLMIPRPVVFPAKAEYFAPKGLVGHLFAAYLKSTNQLRMDRGGARSAYATLDAAVEILRRGDLFGFYPEGTRSPDGRLYRGRTGIGYLALQSGAPVLPVAMVGTRKMLPPGSWLPRPTRIEIRIGKPMEFGHLAGDPPGKARRVIAEQVTAAIGDLSGQEYVHEYASDVKDRLAAEKNAAGKSAASKDDAGKD